MDGLLTVTNEAKGAITDTNGIEFEISGYCGGLGPMPTTVTVKRAAPAATSVDIYKGETAVTYDTIAIPQSGSTSVTYTAKVLDQYGSEMGGEVVWSSEPALSGVGVGGGKVSVGAGAEAGTITLTASCGEASGSVNVSVASISFGGEAAVEDALDIAGNPTYGMTWGKIVKVAGEITASVGGTSVEGEYSVKDAGDTPDAGENKEYTILFTSDDGTYSDVEVYTGTVTIAPQAVTVTGITVSGKEYDGGINATVSTEGAVVSVEGVNVTGAAGTFADADAGTDKAVTVEVTLDNGNYTVEDFELKAEYHGERARRRRQRRRRLQGLRRHGRPRRGERQRERHRHCCRRERQRQCDRRGVPRKGRRERLYG